MRVNVYTEELPQGLDSKPTVQIVTADYVSSRTGLPMTNYGLRIFLKSAPELHYIEGRDDDRSSVTFWCGPKEKNVFEFLAAVTDTAHADTGRLWAEKTAARCAETETAELARRKL